jgi:uncharacterized membrane protein YbhN (UPF0104 family)
VLGLFGAWCLHNFQKDLRQINLNSLHGGWWAVAVSGSLSLFNYALRITRWQFYLRHMGHRLPWGFSALSYMAGFAFTLSPGKVGEMVRARYYTAYKVPLNDVTGAFFAERLMDLIVILLLALVMLAALPSYHLVMWLGTGLIGGVVATLLIMPWARVQTWLQEHPRADRAHIKLFHAAATMLLGARRFLSPGLLLGALALGLVAWGSEAVGFKIVGDVIHPLAPLSWTSGIGIYATATLVGALSFLPGGLGSTEAVMASLLYAQGFGVPEALLLTLVCRVLTLWLAVVIGWLCVWLLRHEH